MDKNEIAKSLAEQKAGKLITQVAIIQAYKDLGIVFNSPAFWRVIKEHVDELIKDAEL